MIKYSFFTHFWLVNFPPVSFRLMFYVMLLSGPAFLLAHLLYLGDFDAASPEASQTSHAMLLLNKQHEYNACYLWKARKASEE